MSCPWKIRWLCDFRGVSARVSTLSSADSWRTVRRNMQTIKSLGAPDRGRSLEDMTDTPLPDWMEALASELGLDDTPAPVLDEHVTSLLEVVKNVEFTASGWEHVKKLIRGDPSVTRIPLFQRITGGSEDDLLMFTIMIAIPYSLAKSLGQRLGYSNKNAENIINYMTAAFVIAMSRGYDLGHEDGGKESREERRTRDE